MKRQDGLKLGTKLGYGVGNVTYGLISQVVATYIVVFGTNILGISATMVGFAVSASVIWDAVTDPLMGYFSDHTFSKKFGRRHLYILIGLAGMAISNMILWNLSQEMNVWIKYFLLVVFLICIKSFITVYTTPYTALGAELSIDYNERSSIQGIRTIFFLGGIMIATVGSLFLIFNPTPEYPIGQNNPDAYSALALFTTVIGVLGGVICIISTARFIPQLNKMQGHKKGKISFSDLYGSFLSPFRNIHFRKVAFGYLMSNVAGAMITTLGLHVYTYTFGMTNKQTSIAIAVIFLLAVAGQPFWVYLSRRIDKKPSVITALITSFVGSLLFVILVLAKVTYAEGGILIFLVSIIMGAGIGGLFSLPLSMVADTVDYQELKEGKRSEGTYYGMLTFAYKVSHAVAIMIMGIILDNSGFDPKLLVQTPSTNTVLGLTIGIGGIVSFGIALLIYARYTLTRKEVENIQKKIF